jgi:alpha-aminoadipic semialdehyde synthase
VKVGIRREDKNKWEGRVPLIPEDIKKLIREKDIDVLIQPSSIRAYSDQEYEEAGAIVQEDLSKCDLILAVKEIPIDFFQPKKTYMFFSHTIKGQDYNIPIIKKMMRLKDNLIDYETITNEKGRRLIFFGRFAGLAGMMDTFWALNKRLKYESIKSPLDHLKPTLEYESLAKAKQHYREVGEVLKSQGLPGTITPLVVGISGYGNVSHGAQEMIDLLPHQDIKAAELENLVESGNYANNKIYKVVFKEEDMVQRLNGNPFKLADYYQHPENYTSKFKQYLPYLTVLVNAIYWDERYPRLITKKHTQELYASPDTKLKVIGDISCDIEGAIEPTVKITNPGNPVFVYDTQKETAVDGVHGKGPVILAVDNLPCEIARDSSRAFSQALMDLLPEILDCDFTNDFQDLDIDRKIKKAIILYNGQLTPDYYYLNEYLEE